MSELASQAVLQMCVYVVTPCWYFRGGIKEQNSCEQRPCKYRQVNGDDDMFYCINVFGPAKVMLDYRNNNFCIVSFGKIVTYVITLM